MLRINPRSMWFCIALGGLAGAVAGGVRGGSYDAGTGLLVGMLLGWSARSLLSPLMWQPRSRTAPWLRQKEASAHPSQGQGGDGQPGQQHPQANEGDGEAGRDLEHPRH